MQKIGILGGSFDPFHYGHLSIAQAAVEECNLKGVVLLPTNVQPFKLGKERACESDRVNMVTLIANEYENFVVSTVEAFSNEVSYTYNTLQKLTARYPDYKLSFILGTDSFLELEYWYKAEELLRKESFIIGVRPGYKDEEVEEKLAHYRKTYDADITILHNKILEISSTEIKDRIKKERSISDLVPDCIERYIYDKGLYK